MGGRRLLKLLLLRRWWWLLLMDRDRLEGGWVVIQWVVASYRYVWRGLIDKDWGWVAVRGKHVRQLLWRLLLLLLLMRLLVVVLGKGVDIGPAD